MGDDMAALEAERASARDAGENVREAKVTVAPAAAPAPFPGPARPLQRGGAATRPSPTHALPHHGGGKGAGCCQLPAPADLG